MRETGWLLTGSERDPRRLMLVRLEERMDGSGIWTVECFQNGEPGERDGKYMAEFDNEPVARAAVEATYRQFDDVGRWKVTRYLPDWTRETTIRVPAGPAATESAAREASPTGHT